MIIIIINIITITIIIVDQNRSVMSCVVDVVDRNGSSRMLKMNFFFDWALELN